MMGQRPFDRTAGKSFGDVKPTFGAFACQQRYAFAQDGEPRSRACGRCKGCIALTKKDKSGRTAGEREVSAEVIFITCTFRDGDPGVDGFLTEQCQGMMKALRNLMDKRTREALGLTVRGRKTDEQKALLKASTPRMHFVYVGEKGGENGRRHYHWLIFADKPTGLLSTPKVLNPKWWGDPRHARAMMLGMEHVAWWKHGHVQVEVLPGGLAAQVVQLFTPSEIIAMNRGKMALPKSTDPDQAVKAIRYMHKYVEKSRGYKRRDNIPRSQRETVFGMSNRRPLGMEVINDHARKAAKDGLPWDGVYVVPGVRHSRGRDKVKPRPDGQQQVSGGRFATGDPDVDRIVLTDWAAAAPTLYSQNCVMGAARKQSCRVYVAEFWRIHGHGPEMSEFCRFYDVDRCADDYAQKAPVGLRGPPARAGPLVKVLEPGEVAVAASAVPTIWPESLPVLPAYRDVRRRGLILLKVGGVVVGDIKVYLTGVAKFRPEGNAKGALFLPEDDFGRELPMLDEVQRRRVERRVQELRGPGWLPPDEWMAAAQREAMAVLSARTEALRAVFKPGGMTLDDEFARVDGGVRVVQPDSTVRLQAPTAFWRKFRFAGTETPARLVADYVDRLKRFGPDGAYPPLKVGQLHTVPGQAAALPRVQHDPVEECGPVEVMEFEASTLRIGRPAAALAIARLVEAPAGSVFDRRAILAPYDAAVRRVGGAKAGRPRPVKVSPQQLPGSPAFVRDHFRQEDT
jgi:hypothetical protein